MPRFAAIPIVGAAWLMLVSAIDPFAQAPSALPLPPKPAMVQPFAPPAPPPPPTVQQALQDGVVIVVSKASQQMHVFVDGAHWRSTLVSTGRRGKATPAGVFPILQKKVFHRSNLYSNAPMPYMQRLTWTGIAIHAGHLPGYPASHGCIRVPREFARALYGVTRASNTAVIVANDALPTERAAHFLARNTYLPGDRDVRLAENAPSSRPAWIAYPAYPAVQPVANIAPPNYRTGSQTIQLAAAATPGEAAAHWENLLRSRPDLAQLQQSIVPAVVGSRQVYRLRVSAPGAHSLCSSLKRLGIDCFNVA